MNFSSVRQLLLAGLLILAVLGSSACRETETGERRDIHEESGHPEESSHRNGKPGIVQLDDNAARAAGIQTVKSRLLEVSDFLETTGVVAANEARVAHIRPLSKGIVQKISVLKGDDVERGQPLIEYDNIEVGELVTEYRRHRAGIRRAQARLEVTLKLWERGKELFASQAIAERELDLREAEYRNARETVNALQAEMQQVSDKLRRYGLSQEEIESAPNETSSVRYTTLRAPFSGTIIEYEVAEGEIISPERVLMSVSDLSTVWVLADVYEKDIGLVRKGVEVDILFESYPDRVFKGRITYLGDVVDAKTRTVKVRCEAPNPGRHLKLGLFARIRIPGSASQKLPAVPVSAIQSVEGQKVVFVKTSKGLFEKRVVRTGPERNRWVAVEQGIEAGEDVVTEGSFALKSELLREQLGGGHAH